MTSARFLWALASVVLFWALPGVGAASAELVPPLNCVADTQCRGDAEAMCAASTLHIEVTDGPPFRLWIDRQGPYPARRIINKNNDMQFILDHFGGGYRLVFHSDGRFMYHGNRGKRFSGSCGRVP